MSCHLRRTSTPPPTPNLLEGIGVDDRNGDDGRAEADGHQDPIEYWNANDDNDDDNDDDDDLPFLRL